MVNYYVQLCSPYREAQERISNIIKSFGGEGRIHGFIVDIDFYNHVLLDPQNGQITCYYSPVFGQVREYQDLQQLLNAHCPELLESYIKQLASSGERSLLPMRINADNDMVSVDIKSSIYAFSGRFNQLQRLFTSRVLRDWDEELLSAKPTLPE